jgi:hypothetical protein
MNSNLSLIVMVLALLGASCDRSSGRDYNIVKTSPNGKYRVEIQIRATPPKGTRSYTERGTFRFFKGQDVIDTYSWENSDEYEPSFHDEAPQIEWVDDRVLRMGDDKSDQPYDDEITLSNNIDENIKDASVSYGRYQLFWIFDLAPQSKVVLRASPRFKSDNSPNYYLGYGGVTEIGKKFEGTKEGPQRKSPADGPLKFQITINQSDLR